MCFPSTRFLLPIGCDSGRIGLPSLARAPQIEHTLKALEPVLKRRIERRSLLTRFDRRRTMSIDVQDRPGRQFGTELRETVISENVVIAEAPAMSLDFFGHSPTSRGAQDYLALMGELRAARFV